MIVARLLPIIFCLCLANGARAANDEMPADSPDAPAVTAPVVKPAVPLKGAGIKPATPPPIVDAEPPPPPAIGVMDNMPVANLQALEKITARVSSLEVKVGQPITFGSLTISVKACRKAPAENTPEAAAFLQITEQKPGEDVLPVYSGWMFASSPSLAAMDHPVYDIWLVDCKKDSASAASSTTPPAPPATPK